MTDTQNTPAFQLDRAGRSEEERLAAHVADLRHRIEEEHPELQSPDLP